MEIKQKKYNNCKKDKNKIYNKNNNKSNKTKMMMNLIKMMLIYLLTKNIKVKMKIRWIRLKLNSRDNFKISKRLVKSLWQSNLGLEQLNNQLKIIINLKENLQKLKSIYNMLTDTGQKIVGII
jgi:hypothetical protein